MHEKTYGFSGEHQDVKSLGLLFGLNYDAVQQYKQQILNGVFYWEIVVGMTLEEVENHFSNLTRELESFA